MIIIICKQRILIQFEMLVQINKNKIQIITDK